jgi:hypothetical protein
MTFEQASNLPRSEKISLVTCEAVKPSKIFQLYSSNTYSKQVPYFVSDVKQNGVELEVAPDKDSLTSGTWFFDAKNKTVYVNIIGDDDPKTTDLAIVYKFFFSNVPIVLPFDLSNGEAVEWLPLIRNIGSIGQQLDDENVGIVLESQSSVEFINDGFFDSIYDSLIWENQGISFYSLFNGLPLSESKLIFKGVVESKNYSPDKISFSVKDYFFKLKNRSNLGLFSDLDGDLLESTIGTSKRRIYGQVKQAKTIPIDCTKDGYQLTGAILITEGFNTIIGTGTSFLDEISPGDELIFIIQSETFKFTIDKIESNLLATIATNSDVTINNLQCIVKPEKPYRKKNRRWHIAGHKISMAEAEISLVVNARQFNVLDITNFFPNDVVKINGTVTQITRIIGNSIVLEQAIFPVPAVGDLIIKEPITAIYFGEKNLVLGRDFSLTNTDEAILEVDDMAEFNIARERLTSVNLIFTNGSRIVDMQVGQSADLRTLISPRDWIRKLGMNSISWYEVLSVTENRITLRTEYLDIQFGVDKAVFKNVDIINDDSLILVDCYGIEQNGKWLINASDCVKHLIENDAQLADIDYGSFAQASSDCPYKLSIVIPENINQEAPIIRDIISKINESIFGSLYTNKNQQVSFSILNTRRPPLIEAIRDDDIISWSVQSSQKIVNQVQVSYCPFIDKVTGEQGFSVINYTNEFIDKYIGIKNIKGKISYIFNQNDAEKIAQRTAFYFSLSQSIVTINAKAGFFTSNVNDRIYIDLDRLYKRFAGVSQKKIGIISGIKKTPYNSEIIMNDLGNIFNRCHTIAPGDSVPCSLASSDDRIKFSYIVDPDLLIPGQDEDYLGSNLLG